MGLPLKLNYNISLYQLLKKAPNTYFCHAGCEIDFDQDSGGTICLRHWTPICSRCRYELKEGLCPMEMLHKQ